MKVIDGDRLAALVATAAEAPRRRAHLNLHDDLADPIQRLVMALEPGTYVPPHRHSDKFELFLLLLGRCALLTFDAAGVVTARVELREGGARMAECPAGTWHSVVALEPGTVVVEIKPGPYRPTVAEDFAAWAPAEPHTQAGACRDWLRDAAVVGAAYL